MIPSEPRIAATQAELGYDRLVAIRHLQQQDHLRASRSRDARRLVVARSPSGEAGERVA